MGTRTLFVLLYIISLDGWLCWLISSWSDSHWCRGIGILDQLPTLLTFWSGFLFGWNFLKFFYLSLSCCSRPLFLVPAKDTVPLSIYSHFSSYALLKYFILQKAIQIIKHKLFKSLLFLYLIYVYFGKILNIIDRPGVAGAVLKTPFWIIK